MTLSDTQQRAGPAIDVRAIALSLLTRWRVIAAAEAAALLAAAAVIAVMPANYRSTVQVLVHDPQLPSLSAVGQEASSGREYDAVAMDSEAQVITSASLALRVARDLDLGNDPEFQVRSGWSKRLAASVLARLGLSGSNAASGVLSGTADPSAGVDGPGIDRRTEQAAAILRSHLSAARVPLSYVMVVSATSRNPQTAKLLAATLVREYLADQREVEQQALGAMSDWLDKKLAGLKDQITVTGVSLEKLKLATGERGADRGSLTDQQAAETNAQLTGVRADLAEKAARLEQVRKARQGGGGWSNGAVSAMSSPGLTDLYQRRSSTARLRDQLAARLGERHADVAALDAQLASLDKAVDTEAARAYGELQSGYDIAARKADALSAGLERLKSTGADPDSKVRLQELERTADTQKKAYDSYVDRLDRIEPLKSFGAAGQRIISPASSPDKPSSPPRGLVVAGFLALGFAAAAALVVYLDFFRASLRNMARRETCLGRPVVSRIPFQGGEGLTRRSFRVDAGAARRLRMRLRAPGAHAAARVVLVTSSVAGEGRSAVSRMLASSSAAARDKTLLLTCDASAACVWSVQDRARPGVFDILEGRAELHEAVTPGPVPGCDVIAAGAADEGSGDLLTSSRMSALIARLRDAYDYVVIDGPPAAAAGETLALAGAADQILVVVDPARSDLRVVAATLRLLDGHGDRIAGFAFNDSRPEEPAEPARSPEAARRRSSIQGLRAAMSKAALAAVAVGGRRGL